MDKLQSSVKLVASCVAISCLLGWAVDLVTAHVAVDYFSVHHPKVVDSQHPVVMALVWGVLASWWCGLIAGVTLAAVNSRLVPVLPIKLIISWVSRGSAVIWLTMMAILVGVYLFAGAIPASERSATYEHDRRLAAVAMAHSGEYPLAGVTLAVVIALMVKESRRRRQHSV